jgi:uncharacterized membrane protein required for colicin V production
LAGGAGVDIVLVGFVAALTFGGWRTGFIHRLAGLAFIGISFLAGAYLRGPIGAIIQGLFPTMPADYADLLGYAFVFPVVLAVIHIVAYPFLKDRKMRGMTAELNKALGAILGFVEAVLILSALVVIFDTYFAGLEQPGQTPGLSYIEGLVASFNSSYTVHLLRETTVPIVLAVLGPFLPKDISSMVPTGVPGLPGTPGVPSLPGLPGFGTPKP